MQKFKDWLQIIQYKWEATKVLWRNPSAIVIGVDDSCGEGSFIHNTVRVNLEEHIMVTYMYNYLDTIMDQYDAVDEANQLIGNTPPSRELFGDMFDPDWFEDDYDDEECE